MSDTSKKGFHVTAIRNPNRYPNRSTIIDWTYNGNLPGILPEPLWVSPALHTLHDAQSFALATLLPLAAAAGETMTFPDPVPMPVAEFWNQKMAGLSKFFLAPMVCRIGPVAGDIDAPTRGKGLAQFHGGGCDSIATLARNLERGINPMLVRVHYAGYDGDLPNHIRYELFRHLAKYAEVELVTPSSNCAPWQWNYRGLVGKYLDPSTFGQLHIPTASKFRRKAADNLLIGFQFFFTAMAVIPSTVGAIQIACTAEDMGEPFGLGFLHDPGDYLGLKMIVEPWESKFDEYDYIYNQHPQYAPFVKTCASAGGQKQWCGLCRRCTMSRLLQLAVRAPEAIQIAPNSSKISAHHRLGFLRTAWKKYQQGGPVDPNVQREFETYAPRAMTNEDQKI